MNTQQEQKREGLRVRPFKGGAFKGHRRFVKMLVSQDKIGIERLKFEASADHQWAHNEALMAFSHVSRHFICANVAHRKAH